MQCQVHKEVYGTQGRPSKSMVFCEAWQPNWWVWAEVSSTYDTYHLSSVVIWLERLLKHSGALCQLACHKHASKPKQQKPRTISKQTPHIPHNTQSKGYKCQQKQRLRRTAVLVRLEAGRELTLPDSSANLLRTSNETDEIRSEGPGHRTFTEP